MSCYTKPGPYQFSASSREFWDNKTSNEYGQVELDIPLYLPKLSITSSTHSSSPVPNDTSAVLLRQKSVNHYLRWRRRFGGICLSLLSCVTLSLMALVSKVLREYHPFTLTFWRYMGSGVPSFFIVLWYLFWKREPVLAPLWPLREPTLEEKPPGGHGATDQVDVQERRANLAGILTRGVFGMFVTTCRFWALKYLTLADVSVITQSYSAVVFVFAFLFLHEKCSVVAVISAALAITGVGVLSRPPLITGESSFDQDTLIGLGFASGAMFMAAITLVMTRKLRSINFAVLTFGFGFIGIVVSGSLALSFDVFQFPQSAYDWLLTLSMSSLAFISQIMSVLAIKYEEAGVISIVKISYVLFAIMWQILLLGVYPDSVSIIGASVVLCALILTGVRKWVNTLPEFDEVRQKMKCLLL